MTSLMQAKVFVVRGKTTTTTRAAAGASSSAPVRARLASPSVSSAARFNQTRRRAALIRRAGEGETTEESGGAPAPPAPEVKSDPFGFGTSNGEPDKIVPGFDTAEGGKVGPVGTFFISVLLIVLFGGSLFFTSVPRNAIINLVDLSDDPNAPTNTFK